MNKLKISFYVGILIIILSNCSSPFSSYTVSFDNANNGKLISNRFTTIDGSRVFYSEGHEYFGEYLVGGYNDSNRQNINGSGTIKVMVKMVSENNFEEFGISYSDNGYPSKEINFYINSDGRYTVYWFDNTTSSSYTWTFSAYIKTGLNEWNELRIDYNTLTKTFSFYINNSPKLLEKTFNYIATGTVSFYTSLYNSNTIFPYRVEFKTISPYSYP